ncbi:MAG: Nif3-like dinuclear metal center hexameric protein [Gemmatimonadota bacterium]|nr:Nif3-like dinuclear metal center hexameric protein [Gemmatimonadota bacterium]
MPVVLADIVTALDGELHTADVPDSNVALNGLQVANNGTVSRIATAVDASLAAINAAASAGADLLIVHHGLFWAGAQPVVGRQYDRMRALITGNIALYSTHIPLDLHPTLGNNVLLAKTFHLPVSESFLHYKGVRIGVSGTTEISTAELVHRVQLYATLYGGSVRTSIPPEGRITRRWAICSGMGASPEALKEAREMGIDTLIVGEGTHHSAVDSAEHNVCVVYAGHYATETLGVQALGRFLEQRFDLPWSFLLLPTGL